MVTLYIVVRPHTVRFKSGSEKSEEKSEESTKEKKESKQMKKKRRESIYSDTESMYSVNMNMKSLVGLVILKILFVDIFTSLGDTLTDFLQGKFHSYLTQ